MLSGYSSPLDGTFSSNLLRAVTYLRQGKPVLLTDDSRRENEADLVVAAELIDTACMNFVIQKGSGVVCLSMTKEDLERLDIPMMQAENNNRFQTAFAVSIEASSGVTTGVSAKDRTTTVRAAAKKDAQPSDLVKPGHIFPLRAVDGGLLMRQGHTEGSVDLLKIAGLKPMAVLCELMNEDGTMTQGEDLTIFAERFDVPIISIEEVLDFRLRNEIPLTNDADRLNALPCL